MGNPRQRRKLRSSSNSVRSTKNQKKKLNRVAPVKGPKVLQDAWDKTLTVQQNYAKLGLLSALSTRQSGGVEPELRVPSTSIFSQSSASTSAAQANGRPEPSSSVKGKGKTKEQQVSTEEKGSGSKPRKGMGRIVRDAEGKIVDIILAEEDEEEAVEGGPEKAEQDDETTPWGEAMEEWEWEGEEAGEERNSGKGRTHRDAAGTFPKKREADTEVVEALEELSSRSNKPVPRYISTAERSWLERLVERYGEDTGAMAMDIKLNVLQKTEGEIKRAVRKAGGFAKLKLLS